MSYHDAFFIETQDEENVEEETAVDSAENETAEQSECFINLTNQLALGGGHWDNDRRRANWYRSTPFNIIWLRHFEENVHGIKRMAMGLKT